MRLLSFLFLIQLVTGCNSTPVPETSGSSGGSVHSNADDTLTTGNTPIVLSGCYEMILKQDTATLQIDFEDSTITGTLAYHFWEKDDNTGRLTGVIRDNLIFADYTFASEGTTSVREVIFRIDGEALVPGFGDIDEKDNKIIFTNTNAIQFQDEHPFLKVRCNN